MGRHLLETRVLVRAPLDRTWEFFSDPGNLSRITPPSLGFEILTPRPYTVAEGAIFDYRIRFLGLPARWKSRIDAWVPEERFVDVQLKGPYRSWRHEHRFAAAPEGTWVEDRVEYELPFRPFGELAHALYVRPALEKIFRFRAKAVAQLLESAGSGVAATL